MIFDVDIRSYLSGSSNRIVVIYSDDDFCCMSFCTYKKTASTHPEHNIETVGHALEQLLLAT